MTKIDERATNAVAWRILALLAICCALVFVAPAAEARTKACRGIERQLASLSGSSGGQSASYRRAMKGQQRQIAIAQRRMRSVGCQAQRGFFSREAHPSCGNLRQTLKRMRANLANLKRKAGKGGRAGSRREKRRLQRAYRRNDCDGSKAKAAKKRPRSIVEQIFGRDNASSRRAQARRDREELLEARRQAGNRSEGAVRLRNHGTVRTLCVRTCDGYFFPVSFSTDKGTMRGDAQACANLCPGTEMKLFYHKVAGENVEDMRAVEDDTPYTAIDNAFAYRRQFNANCACDYRAAQSLNDIAGDGDGASPVKERAGMEASPMQSSTVLAARPIWRPDRLADPETRANREGGLNARSLAGLSNEPQQTVISGKRRVRVVGETFLPTQ